MSHANDIIRASVDLRGDVAYVLGRNNGDDAMLCGDFDENGNIVNKISKYAMFRPIAHPNDDYVTMAQRKAKFLGFAPYIMAALKSNYIGTGGATGVFTTIPLPVAWTYNRPTGEIGVAPYRMYDFLYIDVDDSQISDVDGYNHAMVNPPMFCRVTSLAVPWNDVSFVVEANAFTIKKNPAIYMGNISGVEIGMDDLLPRTALGSEFYEPIFGSGHWRFALAIAVKVSETAYSWLIVSSVNALGSSWPSASLDDYIRLGSGMPANPANYIKRALRRYGQTSFVAIPFLAQELSYRNNQGSECWYWNAGDLSKAMTFPEADVLTLTFSGITTTNRFTLVSNSNFYTVGGTDYAIVTAGTTLALAVPKPSSASVTGTVRLKMNFSGYGQNTGFGGRIASGSFTGTLKDANGNVITQIGVYGNDNVTENGVTLTFDTTQISSIAYVLPQWQYVDTAIELQWSNADLGTTITQTLPLRVALLT